MVGEIGFTLDGRKVIVLGQLNSKQIIVQEIFIIDGKEVPAGENFTVKELKPFSGLSWKDNEIARLKDEYEGLKDRYEKNIKFLKNENEREINVLRATLEYAANVVKNVSPDSFNLLVGYLTGEYKYVIYSNYNPQIIEYSEFLKNEVSDGNSFRLVSLYGKDNGDLTFGVSRYSDGSGSWSRPFYPYKSLEESIKKLSSILNSYSHNLVEKDLVEAKKWGIKIDSERLDALRKNITIEAEKRINSNRKEFESFNTKLAESLDLINSFENTF